MLDASSVFYYLPDNDQEINCSTFDTTPAQERSQYYYKYIYSK